MLTTIKPAAPAAGAVAPAQKPAGVIVTPVPAAKPAAAPPPPKHPVRPPVPEARLRRRHLLVAISFFLCVLLPSAVSAWYLWTRATPQYASTVGFTVRREEGGGSALELLGGLAPISGASSSDTDILYEFLQSQRLVADLDAKLDLKAIWSRPEGDPVFTYSGETIEDLLDYWKRMVSISYDSSSGLIEVRVLAFDRNEAQQIASAVVEESSRMINELSAIAREDSIRYSREDLEEAVERLKAARQKLIEFRNRNQIVDPTIDLANQGGLMGSLQTQLAAALIEVDLLKESVREGDPRLIQAQRRVEVIESRIQAERSQMGVNGGAAGTDFPALVGEYEALSVDLEFAQRSYVAAMAAHDAALAESRRKSRYLAAYAEPSLAEAAKFPQRLMLQSILTVFLFLAWSIVVLVAYALRDRR